jgi:hypothetical protein
MERDVLDPASPLKAPREGEDVTRPSRALRSRRCYYRVDRRDISLLRFILEAYEGVASMTTVQPEEGLVMVAMAPGQERLATAVLSALGRRRDLRLEPVAAPPSAGQGEK